MAKEAFLEDKNEVMRILHQIGDDVVRLFKGPASYYKLKKLENAGYLEHGTGAAIGDRGHAHRGFTLSPKGREMLMDWANAKESKAIIAQDRKSKRFAGVEKSPRIDPVKQTEGRAPRQMAA